MTDQQPGLDAIQTLDLLALMDDRAAAIVSGHLAALAAEVRRLRAAMEEIRHLHKDSPMGPCPVCIDADAVAEGRDGLMPYPCPTGRLAGAQDCEPPSHRAAVETHVVADDSHDHEHCGAVHHHYPETVCTEPAGHYRRVVDPHAGPLVLDGRECGGAAWDEPAVPAARSAAV